ncbi:xin actin-binding repeat-containing protein 1 [Chaetodon trifascialis]|uniref:xin actin-binding repeat-containing protein 1 n=1 Tax=Chaetodon trifascialis TaxID=109706 RepID=UPI0039963588
MSALYLSKMAPQESTPSLLKPAQDQSPESGRGVKLTKDSMMRTLLCSSKMAEDFQQSKDDLPPLPSTRHQPGPEDISGAHFQQPMPSQITKGKLYQQRQKCELRRLLKHTHPELKMLDDVVDEELAEVLSSETGLTTGGTGYEGEVLSRCLIFENCALGDKVSRCTPKGQMAEGTAERGDVRKTSAVSEEHEERPCSESVKGILEDDKTFGSSIDPHNLCEEDVIRIDVQATRRIFESQSVNTSRLNPDPKFQGKVSISRDQTGAVQKQNKEARKENLHNENKSNACTKSLDLTAQLHNQEPCVHISGQSTDHQFSGREEVSTGETLFEDEPVNPPATEQLIKTSAALFENNPFIQTNVEREHSFVHPSKSQSPAGDGAAQDYPIPNVKNRANLFESMPFDKIRHQNKDEVETMVENIKETLNSLHHINAIHSSGSIIEVNETMIAKKAKFILLESGPKIKYDEVTEGGAQNLILQLLPRTNLKRGIIYLKEDSKGSMEATVVNVPVRPHHFNTNQDTEFKTANFVQVVEDILNQDNSLRKGVIIQEDVDRCAEVTVYSLFSYFDEEDVKSYYPPKDVVYDEPEPERGDVRKKDIQGLRKGTIESTISCLLETSEDQTCQGSTRPEITVKGNVKLFKSCIEKGDLECLKSLQAEATVQEQDPGYQNVAGPGMELYHEKRSDQAEENTSEWIPVDVKRLKNMFSGDQRPPQPKQNLYENLAQSTSISYAFKGQNVPLGKSQPSTDCSVGVFSHGQIKNTFEESGAQPQKEACNSTVAPQGSYLLDDDRVHQAELVEVVDDDDEISSLQTAIQSLQQATIEAKYFHQSSQEKKEFLVQESSKEPVVSVTAGNVKHSTEAKLPQENEDQKEDPCLKPSWDEVPSANTITITSGHISDCKHENTETHQKDINSEKEQITDACSNSSETTAAQPEDEEVVFKGKLQAAMNSLERSNINVSRGDFRAAMIYRNSSKPRKESSQNVDAVSNQKPTKEELCPVTDPKSTVLRQEISKEQVTPVNAELPSQSETFNKAAISEKSKKPAIPPKPEHLKVKQRETQSTKDEHEQHLFKINSNANSGPDSVDLQRNEPFDEAMPVSQEIEVRHQVQGSAVTLERDNIDKNIINQQQATNVTAEEKKTQDFPVKENMNEKDESHVDFHEACKIFGGKKMFSVKNAPVKPKRVKIAQPDNKNPQHMCGDKNSSILAHMVEEPQETVTAPSCNNLNTCGQTADSTDRHEKEMKQESKVEMREKKGRTETEDERRQRLSVHMDEIMRGNITAAMEIFDNLRKQEELQSILSRVEEIEKDTSEVDVRSLRGVFENVPEWVVSSEKDKYKKVKVQNKIEKLPLTRDTKSKSSMAHVFGDLERASEEIMNLKEQTLARLMDIEEAIKKALYSVSALKSDSDIAGLSCLFKESLGAVQGSPSSGNISKISIGSSRTKSLPKQERPTAQGNTVQPETKTASVEVASAKQQASPPSSPAFISIQSAARKTDKTEAPPPETTICPTCQHNPTTEEKFRTTKTLTCNSPAQNRKRDPRKEGQKQSSYNQLIPKRELSVLEVQTDGEANSVMGTKTITENYERTDSLGNRFYSSKTSTVITAQPDTTSTSQAAVGPAAYQVTKYPEVRLPINQKP